MARRGVAAPVTNVDGAKKTARTVGRFLLVQLVVLAISLATLGIIPFLIWLIALATSFQLFLRIRNIAEHACTATGSDDPFTHARTTYANLWGTPHRRALLGQLSQRASSIYGRALL